MSLLHLNELPLRHSFQHLGGSTSGLHSYAGPIGKQVNDGCRHLGRGREELDVQPHSLGEIFNLFEAAEDIGQSRRNFVTSLMRTRGKFSALSEIDFSNFRFFGPP